VGAAQREPGAHALAGAGLGLRCAQKRTVAPCASRSPPALNRARRRLPARSPPSASRARARRRRPALAATTPPARETGRPCPIRIKAEEHTRPDWSASARAEECPRTSLPPHRLIGQDACRFPCFVRQRRRTRCRPSDVAIRVSLVLGLRPSHGPASLPCVVAYAAYRLWRVPRGFSKRSREATVAANASCPRNPAVLYPFVYPRRSDEIASH
jgi:hypothetical protein